jgi:hypothetical protein
VSAGYKARSQSRRPSSSTAPALSESHFKSAALTISDEASAAIREGSSRGGRQIRSTRMTFAEPVAGISDDL